MYQYTINIPILREMLYIYLHLSIHHQYTNCNQIFLAVAAQTTASDDEPWLQTGDETTRNHVSTSLDFGNLGSTMNNLNLQPTNKQIITIASGKNYNYIPYMYPHF